MTDPAARIAQLEEELTVALAQRDALAAWVLVGRCAEADLGGGWRGCIYHYDGLYSWSANRVPEFAVGHAPTYAEAQRAVAEAVKSAGV